ncbi:hypothetical protein [Bacillus thuringiensis]|uniref:Uncharacterized protein n=1 Tax=Bacillus thuringiensis subsp. jegathesan TaxID=56955 RepID=A0A9X6M2M5_BACTJ|nr:hypothetical protein [Bacillus thuringiensis]OUB57008.1 hypothetical protein BK750_33380 [Bacillus thuringiensis serovar jegathesan]
MSKLVDWANEELNRLSQDIANDGDNSMQEEMNKCVLGIVKVFSEQGHSGMSAAYALGLIKRLLSWKPITPLTGEESEWNDVGGGTGESTQQNNRCSAIFRENNDNSTAYYIDGKVFSDDGGVTWFTNRDSRIPIVFPFVVPDQPEYVILSTQKDENYETRKSEM